MEYLDNKIIAGVISFTLIGLFGWFKIKSFSIYDRHIIYKWLKSHTKDAPGESHIDAITIAKGTILPENRVRSACMSCDKIFRYSNGKEQWSIWRERPQSCYEGLSKEEIRERIAF